MDARRAPSRVLGNHAEDEFAQFFAHAFSSRAIPPPREPSPILLESRFVPAHNGLRLNENQRLLPSRPKPSQHHPKQFILSGKPRLGLLPPQNCKLLPKRHIFQEEVATGIDRPKEQGKQELQRTEHMPVVAERSSDMLPRKNQVKFVAVVAFIAVKALLRHKNQQRPERLR